MSRRWDSYTPGGSSHLNILFLGDILSGQPGALLWSPPSRIPLPLLTEVPRALSPWRTQDGYKQVPSLQVEARTIQECPPEPRPSPALGTCCLEISKKGVISAPFCSQGASPWPECSPSLAAPAASTYMGPGSSMNLWQGHPSCKDFLLLLQPQLPQGWRAGPVLKAC